jgi:hypothetical protein
MRVSAIAALTLLCASCAQEEGPLMAAGQDCVECHGGGEARAWTVAGWTKGARVTVVDANGKSVEMRGNKVGNFYTAESLAPPYTVTVDGLPMPQDALKFGLKYGGCNLCHVNRLAKPDLALMAPGRDCMACHDDVAALKFTIAGTWKGSGHVVRVVDSANVTKTFTTNAAGNLYTSDPVTYPLTEVWVDNERKMTAEKFRGAMHGSCNAAGCHGGGKHDDD